MATSSNNSGLSMPMTPEEITTEWLGSILGHKVQSFTIPRSLMDQTTGKVFVELTYEDAAAEGNDRPSHMCLKGSFNPVMANMPGYSDLLYMAYSNEVNFYKNVAPKLPASLRLPKVWWAGSDPTKKQGICAMEDLCQRPGIRFGDGLQPSSVAEAKGVMEQLAALHGATWGGIEAVPQGTYETVMLGLCLGWERTVLDPARFQVPTAYRDQARSTAALKKHFATRNPRFQCLVHNDAHIGNLFFHNEAAAGAPSYLDWQFPATNSAFHDVAYYLTGALTVEDRRRHEDEVLEHYLAALLRSGGPKLDLADEEVRNEYRKNVYSGLGWVLTPDEMQGKERVYAMMERYSVAFEDHKVMELIESLPEPAAAS